MPKLKSHESFSDREITIYLNNVLRQVSRPRTGLIDERRFPKLREFMEALIEPLMGLRDEECITLAEMRWLMVAAAVYVHGLAKLENAPV